MKRCRIARWLPYRSSRSPTMPSAPATSAPTSFYPTQLPCSPLQLPSYTNYTLLPLLSSNTISTSSYPSEPIPHSASSSSLILILNIHLISHFYLLSIYISFLLPPLYLHSLSLTLFLLYLLSLLYSYPLHHPLSLLLYLSILSFPLSLSPSYLPCLYFTQASYLTTSAPRISLPLPSISSFTSILSTISPLSYYDSSYLAFNLYFPFTFLHSLPFILLLYLKLLYLFLIFLHSIPLRGADPQSLSLSLSPTIISS